MSKTDYPPPAVGEQLPAVLFDVDGTLVDSNYLHVYAWRRAFAAEGFPAEAWRIHRCIGMDGSALVNAFAADADEDTTNRLQDRHSRFYRETMPMIVPLPGARALLHRVADLGLQVVLATSAPDDELQILREVLDCDDVVTGATSSGDVDTAKPEPDIVCAALARAGANAERAVFVGDAVWDVEAARRAGVPCLGVLSGGVPGEELLRAGAVAVFDNAAQLLDHLDETPIVALNGRYPTPSRPPTPSRELSR